jgi:hypothetical protein
MRGSILLPAAVAVLVVAELAGRDVAPARLAAHRKASRIFGRRLRAAASAGRFRRSVSAERLAAFHAAVTRQPHMAGSPGSGRRDISASGARKRVRGRSPGYRATFHSRP